MDIFKLEVNNNLIAFIEDNRKMFNSMKEWIDFLENANEASIETAICAVRNGLKMVKDLSVESERSLCGLIFALNSLDIKF